MRWSATFAGKPPKIIEELLHVPELSHAMREACAVALESLDPNRDVVFETAGFIDGEGSSFRIDVRPVDKVV